MRKAIFTLVVFVILTGLAVYIAQPVNINTPDVSLGDAEIAVLVEPVKPETVLAPVLEPSPVFEVEMTEPEPEEPMVVTLPFTLCYVTGNDVRERKAPVDGKVATKHQRGDIVEVEDTFGEWWRLTNGHYMFAEYLLPVEEGQYFFEQPTFYVSGNGVRERTGPSTNYDEVTKHSIGEPINVVGEKDGWYRLTNGNYVCGDYVVQTREEAIQAMADYYGDFALVSISGQYVEFYDNGALIVRADVVTGHSTKSPTPTGVYQVQHLRKNFDMNGNSYNHVEYAVFFNGGIAIHDAAWRHGKFGGSIYKNNGSHGCVNTSLEAASIIYENSRKGMYVIVFP